MFYKARLISHVLYCLDDIILIYLYILKKKMHFFLIIVHRRKGNFMVNTATGIGTMNM